MLFFCFIFTFVCFLHWRQIGHYTTIPHRSQLLALGFPNHFWYYVYVFPFRFSESTDTTRRSGFSTSRTAVAPKSTTCFSRSHNTHLRYRSKKSSFFVGVLRSLSSRVYTLFNSFILIDHIFDLVFTLLSTSFHKVKCKCVGMVGLY